MKRGFTILELLVASLLLGMLVTVLTMIFNQSSVAWRTGLAGLMDMDLARDNIAVIRDEADGLYVWQNKLHRTVSVWDEKNATGDRPKLKERALAFYDGGQNYVAEYERAQFLGLYGQASQVRSILTADKPEVSRLEPFNVGMSQAEGKDNWIVNVKSAGPNGKLDDYDDIWSNPDEFK